MASQFRWHMLSRHWPAAAAFHFRFVCWRVNCICVLQTPQPTRLDSTQCRRVLFSGLNAGKQHCKSQFRRGYPVPSRWTEVTSAYSTFVQSSRGKERGGGEAGALSTSMRESPSWGTVSDCLVPSLCLHLSSSHLDLCVARRQV